MDRRTFLKNLTLGTTIVSASALTTNQFSKIIDSSNTCTEDLEVTVTQTKIKDLPNDFKNYRIGFISDQHLSTSVSEEFIDHSFKSLAKAGIDILVLGGDYIYNPDNFLDRQFEIVRTPRLENLSDIKRSFECFDSIAKIAQSVKPKDGIIAVYGNHDRWNHPLALEQTFRENQIPLLKNNLHFIARGDSSLLFIGVDDYMTGTPHIPSFEKIDKQSTVLISHNPDFLESIVNRTDHQIDLVLCGHTHGGQIKLPIIGAIKNIYMTEFFEGYVKREDLHVYTSRGIGTVFVPYRYGARPEASIVELV